jgi:hypothetical protein
MISVSLELGLLIDYCLLHMFFVPIASHDRFRPLLGKEEKRGVFS